MTHPALDERTRRVKAAATESGADWAVLSSAAAVAYATGYAVPSALRSSPFAGGPAIAIVGPDGRTAVVVPDVEAADVPADRVDLVVEYPAFYAPGFPAARGYARAVEETIERLGASGPVGVEPATLPATLAEVLSRAGERRLDIGERLDDHRATKTHEEVVALRASARVAGAGQRAAAASLAGGHTELDVLAAVRRAIERAARAPVELELDLLSGRRTAHAMGAPTDRLIEAGDLVLIDLVPRVGCYWGDSCTTLAVGTVPPEVATLHVAAAEALDEAREILRPGVTAGAVAERLRGMIERAGFHDPIHLGHGIGTANVEHPRLQPGETTVLREGMVLMVEPCAVQPGLGGVRLERMFRLTATGSEDLSDHPYPAPLAT